MKSFVSKTYVVSLLIASLAFVAGSEGPKLQNLQSYGSPAVVETDIMTCMFLSSVFAPEIQTVQAYGLEKYQYMDKIVEAAKDAPKERKPVVDRLIYDVSRMWDAIASQNGTEASNIVNECIASVPQPEKPKI